MYSSMGLARRVKTPTSYVPVDGGEVVVGGGGGISVTCFFRTRRFERFRFGEEQKLT